VGDEQTEINVGNEQTEIFSSSSNMNDMTILSSTGFPFRPSLCLVGTIRNGIIRAGISNAHRFLSSRG
jgi:hypothetical protein